MFSVDPTLQYLPAKREQVVELVEGVNQPHVALPGKPPQAARAWICGLRNPNATFSMFIYLLLVQTGEPLIYAYGVPQFALAAYREAESEAVRFVEGMGFLVERLGFRNQPLERQAELMARIPAFAPPAKGTPLPKQADRPDARLARLLAAF